MFRMLHSKLLLQRLLLIRSLVLTRVPMDMYQAHSRENGNSVIKKALQQQLLARDLPGLFATHPTGVRPL